MKGVIFISSPLNGATVKKQVQDDQGWAMSIYNNFMQPVYGAITGDETSKTSQEVLEAKDYQKQNQKFLNLCIPYIIVQETEKALLPAANKKYFFVPPEETLLGKEGETVVRCEGKSHREVQRAASKDELLVQEILKFIESNL